MFLMLMVNNLKRGTENEVPNLSLLQALEKLFSCPEPEPVNCLLQHCTTTSNAEDSTGTRVAFASQVCAALSSALCQGFLLAWLFVSRFCKATQPRLWV